MVTLAPMFQFGWRSASCGVAAASLSFSQSRKGPPEAVRWMRSMAFPEAPIRHWKMAECSESTGRMTPWFSRAVAITMLPAATRVSLLARARIFPWRRAASDGFSPLNPTMAPTTMSTCELLTSSHRLSTPAKTLISWP